MMKRGDRSGYATRSAVRRCGAVLFISSWLCACAPREVLLPLAGVEPPALRAFPADFEPPLSFETDRPMPGFGGGGGGLTHTPILFVHGNTESARFWLPAREYFLAQGWTPDELWAFGYGWDSVRWFDGNDLSAPSIGRMVDAMTAYLSKKSGREIRQIDIVAHSLGVTAVRQWMKQANAWHRVRVFVAVAGANHGTWTARMDARGQNRITAFELAPASPWLAQLNEGGETPGPTRYLALYDGSGRADVLFPPPLQHSPRLEGARNIAFNAEHDAHLDHRELPRTAESVAVIADFLRAAGEPIPQAEPPIIVRDADELRAEPAPAQLACATGRDYPGRTTVPLARVALQRETLTTCYALDAVSGLSSPMARYSSGTSATSGIRLRAEPSGGSFEMPQQVRLEASEPGVAIYYTTIDQSPDTGSPLYGEPINVPGPLRLRAVAIAADGRRSPELRLRFDISLELLEAQHSLQSQFEPDSARPAVSGRRKGR